jgi:hypothetical protein
MQADWRHKRKFAFRETTHPEMAFNVQNNLQALENRQFWPGSYRKSAISFADAEISRSPTAGKINHNGAENR